jgi:uncharacterized repeat protein (TIGR03803 family)
MHSTDAKNCLNISNVAPRFGPTKPAAAIIRFAFTSILLSVLLIVAAHPAQSQEVLLHTFGLSGDDGQYPESSLAFDNGGNLYGTTADGGLYGGGTVYELMNGAWDENILYNFTGGSDGNCYFGLNGSACSNLIIDGEGNLYGTAPAGGAFGAGVVFELSPTGTGWTETVLHSFGGPGDGYNPWGGVIMDDQGNLYGTTNSDYYETTILGVVYELSLSGGAWTESILYSLPSNSNNNYLESGLAMDAAGNLYGTSYETVFELSPNGHGGWNPTVIHTFTGPPKDAGPGSAPLVYNAGNLYGVSDGGGSMNDGAVYKLTPGKNGKWAEKLLYSFKTSPFCCPYHATSVVLDATGNLYGTAGVGGNFGEGMIYELVAPVGTGAYKEKTLFSFNDPYAAGNDGAVPFSSLVFDNAGNLYGTTQDGGSLSNTDGGGYGTVFEFNPSAAATTTALTSVPNPSTSGEAVTFTAVVTPAPPDGETISFMEGTTVLGTGLLSDGSATYVTSTLPVGTSKITAVYGGDLTFHDSTSNTIKQVVKK